MLNRKSSLVHLNGEQHWIYGALID